MALDSTVHVCGLQVILLELDEYFAECTVCVLYEMWQKSNATDFLLTMHFLLLTNQGFPLQNSSLG
jgi:hypothetical protein